MLAFHVRLIEQLHEETAPFHQEADADGLALVGSVAPADYWRFLTRCHGVVTPIERAILATPRLETMIDTARFHKHELLRRDLICFRMRPDEIDALPRCRVPRFESPEEALGWAYPIERSTLGHATLFRHLAMLMPGDVAFTSSYLKCYLGALGETWRSFGLALDRIADVPERAQRVIDGAKAAFRACGDWRLHPSLAFDGSASDSGEHRRA